MFLQLRFVYKSTVHLMTELPFNMFQQRIGSNIREGTALIIVKEEAIIMRGQTVERQNN